MIRRFEDWGIDHLNFVVMFALVFNIIVLAIVVALAVAT